MLNRRRGFEFLSIIGNIVSMPTPLEKMLREWSTVETDFGDLGGLVAARKCLAHACQSMERIGAGRYGLEGPE